jgi:hypothetical protein
MAQTILIIGAGKSATVLIQYLQQKAVENDWYILLADGDEATAKNKWNNAPNGTAFGINIENEIYVSDPLVDIKRVSKKILKSSSKQ